MNEMPPVGHRVTKGQVWHIGKFRKDELFSQIPEKDYGKELDNLTQEIYFNPNNTIKPLQWIRKWNVLTLVGLEECAKRDTGQTTTTITHVQLGTDGTAENESQTVLGAPVGTRKQYSTQGTRIVLSGTQTAKYSMVFLDTDFTVPITLREAGQFTLVAGGIMHSRIQYPDFTLNTGEVIVTQINETLVNG